jgi:hypothetical protein
LLQRSVAVEIERDWVRPISHRGLSVPARPALPAGNAPGWKLRLSGQS